MAKAKDRIFTRQALEEIFESLREEGLVSVRNKADNFIQLLIGNKYLRAITINGPSDIQRYITGNVSDFEIALSIAFCTTISHVSALLVHGFSLNSSRKIFITQEQSEKRTKPTFLLQENVDSAFSKPQRPSNSVYTWKNNQIYLLKGKKSGNLGCIQKQYQNARIYVTDLEKTLLDITVRPGYAGGVGNVMKAYIEAKGIISVRKLYDYLKRMEFIYPYHQAIGFFLQYAGYTNKEIGLFRSLPKEIDFYLDYYNSEKFYNSDWRIYVPPQFAKLEI